MTSGDSSYAMIPRSIILDLHKYRHLLIQNVYLLRKDE